MHRKLLSKALNFRVSDFIKQVVQSQRVLTTTASNKMTDTVFTEGDVLKLPTDPLGHGQVMRLYSMRMCPYAQRARLIAAAKRVPTDLINVDLNNKPDWFFDLNPYGEVPVVIHQGRHIYESLITAEYLEEAFETPKLMAEDAYTRAYERIYYNHWTKKGIPAFYSLLKAGYADPEQSRRLMEHVKTMELFLVKLGKPYFHGKKAGFSDYMIWPWFERMPMLKSICDFEFSSQCPRLQKWVELMWQDPAVQMCVVDIGLMTTHYEGYRTGKPDFTLGATKPPGQVDEALENLDGLRDPSTRDRMKTPTSS